MKQFAFLTACAAFFLGSCDQHEWESKPGKPGAEELFKHEPKKKDGEEKKEAH